MSLDEHDVIEARSEAPGAEELAPEVSLEGFGIEAASAAEEPVMNHEPEVERPTLPSVEAFMPKSEPAHEEIRAAPVVEAPEAPRRELLLWPKSPSEDEAPPSKTASKPKTAFRIDPLGLAASLAAIGFIAVGVFAGYDHAHQSAQFAAKSAENQELQKSVAGLKARIEAIEVARSQEQTAELHKTLAEIKTVAANAQGVTASVVQLGQRVDRLEKDQNARIDKLGDKFEQTTANRYSEIVARLEKLEKKPTTVALAQPAPPTPPTPQAKPSPSPSVANDITGSIDKPKTILRGYVVDDVRGGVAYLESRDGPYSVSAGDVLPGAGRVLRIERHGPNWVVVTSQGVITSPEAPY